jgi:hypothetical protein
VVGLVDVHDHRRSGSLQLATFDRRPFRDVANLVDKVPLDWNRTLSLTNTPTSRKNIASTTNE